MRARRPHSSLSTPTVASLLRHNQASLLSRDDEASVFLPANPGGRGQNESMTLARLHHQELVFRTLCPMGVLKFAHYK